MAMVTSDGRHLEAEDMFAYVEFKKKGGSYKKAAQKKIKLLQAKIAERIQRIKNVMLEYKITDADLADQLGRGGNSPQYTAANYSTSPGGYGKPAPGTIPAGVLQHIITEREQIQVEKAHVARLGILARNIDPKKEHKITFDELEFLGF